MRSPRAILRQHLQRSRRGPRSQLPLRQQGADCSDAEYDVAVALLRSSSTHYLVVWVSFILAVTATVWAGTAGHPILPAVPCQEDQSLVLVALFFIVSQAGQFDQTCRNRTTAGLPMAPPGLHFYRGTDGWYAQVLAMFALSVCFGAWGLLTLNLRVASLAVIGMGILFALSATLNLSKALGDRGDADFWQSCGPEQRQNVLSLARGSWMHAAQTWLFFLASIVGTIGGLLVLNIDMIHKAFLGMGLIFMTLSSIHLARSLRDMVGKTAVASPMICLTAGAALLSFAGTFGSIFFMELERDQQSFVALSALCTQSTGFAMSKLMMDTEELMKFRHSSLTSSLQRVPVAGGCHLNADALDCLGSEASTPDCCQGAPRAQLPLAAGSGEPF